MPRTLLYSGMTVNSELKRESSRVWSKVMRAINPGIDMMIYDTASKIDPASFIEPGIDIKRYDDNVGHLSHGGGDGSGRTFSDGLTYAIDMGYDYAVTCEPDCYFVRPVQQVVERMDRAGVKVGCLMMPYYQFLEWGFAVYNCEWARRTKLVERYDWRNAKPVPIPEQKMEWLCGDDLFILPYRGIRNSQHWVDANSIAGLFPYGPPDWLHENSAQDMNTINAFLRLTGVLA